jgi:two-component system chemotaxis sensor kinase CheA
MQDHEVIREFIAESFENLSRLDQELVELEKRPKDGALLANIFRTIHTIKGTCGFLGFSTLEAITHQAETLLSQLRDGQREMTQSLASLILETVDATRKVLASIEASGEEGSDRYEELMERLRKAAEMKDEPMLSSGLADSGALRAAPQGSADSRSAAGRNTEDEAARPSAAAEASIRVGVGLLDNLMCLVGELVLTRNQILQYNNDREDPALNAAAQRLNLITSELQEGVMKTRMQPIKMVWNKLPRVVRDMAVALGKQILLEMDGADTELDRTIIEAIKDPLIHLVRNACDHGIEPPEVRVRAGKPPQGRITLRAYHEGGQVNIEISDDGSGIDVARIKQKAIEKGVLRYDQAELLSEREALSLIFQPGLSTAQTVTNISGRGVGMDVVKSHIERIGGSVDVSSRLGQGTVIRLKIPLTLAIIPGLVVGLNERRSAPRQGDGSGMSFVIPQVNLVELVRLEGAQIGAHTERIGNISVYRLRGNLLPLVNLRETLGIPPMEPQTGVLNIVVVQAEGRQFGLVVDSIFDTQEIVVKPLGKQLKGLSVYAGATIMGNGQVALILDVVGIAQRSKILAESRRQTRRQIEQHTVRSKKEQQKLLLFRAGSLERLAVPLALVSRLEEFPRQSIEHAGGREVVQYRNCILPLVSMHEVVEGCVSYGGQPADPLQVVVFNDGNRSVGLVVDEILDIVDEEVTSQHKSSCKGLLCSAVVGKHVVDFLDLGQVIRAADSHWFQRANGADRCKRVLVAEGSSFARTLIRSGLEMGGYNVLEAADLQEALRRLEQEEVNVVAASLDLPPSGGSALVEAMQRRPEWKSIPVLALADAADRSRVRESGTGGFRDCQAKFDWEAMLESLARLTSALASAEAAPLGVGKD